MIYLSDRITVNHTFSPTLASAGIYRYEVMCVDEFAQTEADNSVVFSGSFYTSSRYRYTFDITEILRNRGAFSLKGKENLGDAEVSLIDTFYLRIYTTGSTYVTTSQFDVAKIYRYPFRHDSTGIDSPNNVFFNRTGQSTSDRYRTSITAQGFNRYTKQWKLMPRYPLLPNEQDYDYTSALFGVMFECGSGVQDTLKLRAYFAGDDPYNDYFSQYSMSHINYDSYCHGYFGNIGSIVNRYGDESLEDVMICLYDTNTDTSYDIARLEVCHERYYLMWQDRFGSIQSQPFSDKATYSEDITNNEIQNYQNVRSKGSVVVQPKWKLNSGWIKEELFPIYESIYVSPILKLYDSVNDVTYDVIVDANYVEKKFENEKRMLNIELELEATSKQNIIY